MILVVDNYDSFVFNLARYLEQLGAATEVVRNDRLDVEQVASRPPQAIVLSPGPCTPREAGCTVELVRRLHRRAPILGVCLGHQAIAAAFGGRVVPAAEPMHGRASLVAHRSSRLLAGLPNPLTAGRYHSLAVDEASLPECLNVVARTADGTVMAIEHRTEPVFGVQFHPESILTERGYDVLASFLRIAGTTPCPAPLTAFAQAESWPAPPAARLRVPVPY